MSRSRQIKFIGLSASLLMASTIITPVYADEDPGEICGNAASLFKDGDVEGALEEARWCVTQLEQLKQNQTADFFQDEINGYTGGELSSQQAMGMQIIERSYSKDGQMISVSLTGGAMGAANSAFAALASFGMQSAQGTKTRIQRRTAVITEDSGSNQIVVTLKSGGLLTFDGGSVAVDELTAFAKAFPVADLDDSIK